MADCEGEPASLFGDGSQPSPGWRRPTWRACSGEYEATRAEERQQEEAEQATFGQPETGLLDCDGAESSDEETAGDLHVQGGTELTPTEAERYPAADVRRVEVDTEGEDLCVRLTLGGSEIEDRLLVELRLYSPKQNPTSLGGELQVHLELDSRGRARLVYEDLRQEDEYGCSPLVPIPARIGREGDTVSFRVARQELLEVMGDSASELPGWDGFPWGGTSFYVVEVDGHRRAISDDVYAYLGMISHPGGLVYDPGERQERDLPTD